MKGESAKGGEYPCKEYSNKLTDMTSEKSEIVRTSNLARIFVDGRNSSV